MFASENLALIQNCLLSSSCITMAIIYNILINKHNYLNESERHNFSSGQYFSSSPLGQSGIPSQSCGLDMHKPESHINWCFEHSLTGASVVGSAVVVLVTLTLPQPNSSELSPQSLIPLNNKIIIIYLRSKFWNFITITFPPIWNTTLILASKHPIMTRGNHNIWYIWFCSCCITIFFIGFIVAIIVTIFIRKRVSQSERHLKSSFLPHIQVL